MAPGDQEERARPIDETPPIGEESGESPPDVRVAELLEHSIDVPVLARVVEQQEAPDAADTLEHLEDEDASEVLVEMDEQAASDALSEMEPHLAEGVIEDLTDEGNAAYAARLLTLMAPDDAADLLQYVDKDLRERLYAEMPARAAASLRRLGRYAEDSAAGLMTTEYLALNEGMTVGEATEVIRGREIPEDLHHLPVVDDAGRLVGTVGLRPLLLHPSRARVADFMERSVKAIGPDLDQEEVAREFQRYDLHMLPVIDAGGRLLGIVTVDDVIDIIREEQTEDVQRTVGAGPEEGVYSGLPEKLRGRFPWLAASLVLSVFAVAVVALFSSLIGQHPILAVMMPVVAALVGNAGHQALAVTLRGIVLDQVRPGRVWPLIVREGAVGLANGAALGLLIWGLTALAADLLGGVSWRIGALAGISLAVSMCAGTLAGSGIPLLMRRLGADPAQSSAIFLIMITDALAFATFLGLARLLL